MNYTLQVIRGRTQATSLKLIEGVNSIGRHDDCLIRIRSTQVSRRHCELFENEGRLVIRDLGSSNGTFVNGARIGAQQVLNPGDVITVGGVALRIDSDAPGGAPPAAKSAPATGDTAELEAAAVDDEDQDDFEVGLDIDDMAFEQPADHLDIIPLDDEPAPEPRKKASGTSKAKQDASKPAEPTTPEPPADDAVAQFLMDLKLDDED